jgi:hypothetical protein
MIALVSDEPVQRESADPPETDPRLARYRSFLARASQDATFHDWLLLADPAEIAHCLALPPRELIEACAGR